jgi:methionyl-tRNA formyltransferase
VTRLWALCTVEAGVDYLRALKGRVPIGGIIGLSDRPPSAAISGFRSMAATARELSVPFVSVDDYRLQAESDRERILGLPMDGLLVCGWQRLVPSWLIELCGGMVIGIHGSASGIHGGRGRSPQNWAIMLGADRFEISIFFIDAGVDSGAVIGTAEFPLTEFDDIRSSYHKASLAVADLLFRSIESGDLAVRRAAVQLPSAFYLPQRVQSDGSIDWRRSTREVHAFVRALSRPYPGAFSTLNDGRTVIIWRARPFTIPKPPRHAPGEVLAIFADDSFLVGTSDGALLVDESEFRGEPRALASGDRFESVDFVEQMRIIVHRHRSRHPDQPLSPDILRAAQLV